MCQNTIATAPSSNRSRSRSKTRSRSSSKPAFPDAKFDKNGCCVKHDTVKLAEQIRQDGRLLWKEVKMNCPKCASEHHKSRRVTSLGGAGKVKRGRTVHGQANPLRDTQKSGRNMDVEYDTPFDDQGRCHHHPRVQMATKRVRGGWKILVHACPKCIEAKYDEDCSVASSKSGGSRSSRRSTGRDTDDGSVSSRSSKRSVTSRNPAVSPGANFDKNGCCTRHPCLQIAKKKLLGVGGWKEFRSCPKCVDPSYDDMSEVASVSSRRSNTSFRSTGSRKSTRSVKSNASRKGGRKTDRYGMLPFDEEGYCHAHPSVRIAKKKALGGWKVIHDICPDCANDASSVAGSTRSRGSSRKSSGTGRYYDDSGSDASSYKSGRSASSSTSRKKKIRVKAMKCKDENGKEGRYTGDVNEDHQPHGHGKIKYKDGAAFDGVWSEGSQVHGKSYRAKSSRCGSSDKKKDDWSSGKREGEGGKKLVKRMMWLDYYGDPGEYTGEVDSSGMPDGKGSMKYDHGLIQDGNWRRGQFIEGSDEDVGKKKPSAKATKSSRRKEP
eukprot:scaffold737_cov120-Skeletonema_menzelii.AAC.1